MPRLLRETPWSVISQDDTGLIIYQSKLKSSVIQVDPNFVQRNWRNWSDDEQLDFAKALAARERPSAEDCAILHYLITNGTDIIASTVVNALVRCAGREMVRDAIMKRVNSTKEPRANFFKALGTLGDPNTIAVLLRIYEALAEEIAKQGGTLDRIVDFLSCCAALARLTKDLKYRKIVETYITAENEIVRRFARTLIEVELSEN